MVQTIRKRANPARTRPAGRVKLVTTVGLETHAYLRDLVLAGAAPSLGEAVDRAVDQVRAENRARLERETAEYFERLSPEQVEEESRLAAALDHSLNEIDFDR